MPDIVLSTLNAKFLHSAFGLRYLMVNLGNLATRTCIREFDIQQRPLDIAERILSLAPRIIGLGVYIWNTRETLEVVRVLKAIAPQTTIVLGGPEVSHELEGQPLVELADYVITGEADHAFRELCTALLSEGLPATAVPANKVIHAPPPEATSLALPYSLYTESDIAHRIVYVEASRGCPFTCEFCLSSLEIPVRQFDVDLFLAEMQSLYDRGVQHFKFVDRTFNLNLRTSAKILSFFLERLRPGLFVHFEMVPDRLPEALRALIKQFPPGTLQFEVGIQTFNPAVAALISRKQDYEKLADNLLFLRSQTGVHIHADLIAGLPGENVASFAAGFDKLVLLGPQEIQVGILKRLRGTPIRRHTEAFEMLYSVSPPYEILQTKHIPFPEMQKVRRFAKLWDQIGNSGNFSETTRLLWTRGAAETTEVTAESPFASVMEFAEWLNERNTPSSGLALKRLAEYLKTFLLSSGKHSERLVLRALSNDFHRLGRFDKPAFLSEFEKAEGLQRDRSSLPRKVEVLTSTVSRQARHLSGGAPPTPSASVASSIATASTDSN